MIAQRYMHLSGATSRDFGAISVADRKHAANNPKAYFYEKPITIEDHQNSRWIAEPLRLLDCCQETDGAVAIVVTRWNAPETSSSGRRSSRRRRRARAPTSTRWSATTVPNWVCPRWVWWVSSCGRSRVCRRPTSDRHPLRPLHPVHSDSVGGVGILRQGEAKDFIADGAIEMAAASINTHGGQLGEAYIHGMNGIAEGVRQLRGTSVNPVPNVEQSSTAGTGVPTSGLILG